MRHYIYKITNMETGQFYIGKHTEKDGEDFLDYMGSYDWSCDSKYLNKTILELVDKRENLPHREKQHLYEWVGSPLCVNTRVQGSGGQLQGIKMPKKWCDKCGEITTHSHTGTKCYKCFTKETYYKTNMKDFFKSEYYTQFCDKCGSEQKMRKVKGSDYCERCHKMENKFKLVKNDDGTVSLFSSGVEILHDCRRFKGIEKIGNGFKLPEGALTVESQDGTTNVKSVLKNKNVDCWLAIDLGFDDELVVTTEHPLVTDYSDFVKAEDLKVGDKLLYKHGDQIKTKEILGIRSLDKIDSSYDLETESGFFNLGHNIISRNSRGGGQVVFASVNFGMDTSREGRLVSKCLMQAQAAGLGRGETPIFPILIFKVKEGINYNPGDPNYDLFKMSMEVTAKRLFPNWIFEDSPFNADYGDDPKDACATMGCRTRLFTDVYGKNTSRKRGNASFTSINLPRLAILADHDIDKFFSLLDSKLQLVHDQLLERFEWQCSAIPDEFKYMAENNTQAEDFKRTGNIRDALKHSSLSVGFIGLAETLIALIGKHHGEDDEAQALGLKIVKHMRDFCDKKKDEEHLNWTLLATPAEGLAERFVKMDKERFGIIQGVTDKDYYTNSFHVPVYYPISAFDKIEKEAPYHALCNAGHITYVELDGDPSDNIEALEAVVRKMHDEGIGYGAINHPLDKCRDCGYRGAGIDTCPVCGSKNIERLRRITGYLVGTLSRWNDGKRAEEHDRVKHNVSLNDINGVYNKAQKAAREAAKQNEQRAQEA